MQRWRYAMMFVAGGLLAATAAEENFSKAVRADEFSAAGLGKLTPAEIARLDALVRDFKSGALERARREAAAAESRAAQAEARAAAAASVAAASAAGRAESEKKSDPGLLAKAKVMLTPGTQIEYSTVESRIAGTFRGWEGRTIFTLENGQRWQVTGSDGYVSPALTNPAVKITPGMLGSFWMTIDGVKPRVKVVLVGGAK